MTPSYPTLQFWFNVLQGIMTVLLFLYTRRVARQKAAEERIKHLEERVASAVTSAEVDGLRDELAAGCRSHMARTGVVEMSVAKLNIEIDHLPTQKQFGELNRSITGLTSQLSKTEGRLEGINRAVDLINEFLINQGKRD